METDTQKREIQKSYFVVLGLCCSSEVPLIEKILASLEGIVTVSVIVPSRTVIVVHDSLLISQLQIVKALNQARLEATVRTYGHGVTVRTWPSPYTIASGVLLALSFFSHVYYAMRWFALGAVVTGLPPMIMRSIAAVRRLVLDINILMLIAVGGSIALRDYMEAGFIVFLFTISDWLESRASYKATGVMSSLMNLAPQKAVIAESGATIDTRDVKISTVLAVKAGEVVPIDGVVVEGRSEVDESTLTGESFPVAKQPQSLVWAGTININGYISVKTTALAEHSAVAKMTKLVEEAQNSKSRTQRLIDSCAKYYTPAVVVIAGALAAVPAATRVHNLKHWFHLALVLLVSACPCALVLSTPVATFCALTKSAKAGLLVKGGDYLEALAKTSVVAFDKTGTLTREEFNVMDFQSINSHISVDTLLYWVSSIESKSSHPMAAALTDYARSNSIEPKPENVQQFQVFPGEGVHGEIDGKCIYVGNQRIATRFGCNAGLELSAANLKDLKGVTVGYVLSEAAPIGVFSLSNTCRTGAAETIMKLKSMGIKTAMLTGDSNAAAMHVQNQLGNSIEMVHAELLPEDKVGIIKDLKNKQGPTTMIGDGMNDAPALASADVGISMGISGSAVAMETSHITLMSNDLRKIPVAIQLARKTQRKIIENIILSVITKVAILALAFSGHPLLWAAVLADVGTCLLVILNSMFLLQTSRRKGKKCCESSHHSHSHGAELRQREGQHAGDHAEGKCGTAHSCHRSRWLCCSETSGECTVIKYADDVSDGSFVKQDCHWKSTPALQGPDHSQNCSESSARHVSGSRDHSVLIDTRGKQHDENCGTSEINSCSDAEELATHSSSCTHKDNNVMECGGGGGGHVRCGKQDWGSEASCFTTHVCRDLQLCRELRKRQIGGCCRSYRKECGKKDMCCGGRLPQLSEIIME